MTLRLLAAALAATMLMAQGPGRFPGAGGRTGPQQSFPELPPLPVEAPTEAPTFRSRTQLVQVDVVVKSKDAFVKGLTKDDFELYDNGQRQEIAVFSVRELEKTDRVSEVQPLAEGVVTNRPAYRGPEPVSATVILFDSQNTPVEAQAYARLQALKYLDRSERNELIAVYQLDALLKVRQDFTDDRAKVRETIDQWYAAQSVNLDDSLLEGLTGNSTIATQRADFQRRADVVTLAFETLARNLQGLPGRKKVVWITAALPLAIVQTETHNGMPTIEYTDMSAPLYRSAKALNAANVTLYSVDPRDNRNSLLDPNYAAMIQLAEMTGGKAFYNTNDVASGIEAAFVDTDLTYTLGFYPTPTKRAGVQHSIRVKVQHDGADLRYRSTYDAETEPKSYTKTQRNDTLNAWLQEPLNPRDIPVWVRATRAAERRGFYDIVVVVDLSTIRLGERNGRFVGSVDLAVAPDVTKKPKGLRQTVAINLTPERYEEALRSGLVIVNQVKGVDGKGQPLAKDFHVVVMDNATLKAGAVRVKIEE